MIADSSVESKFGRLPGVDTMAMEDMTQKPTEQFDIPKEEPKKDEVKEEPKTTKKAGKLYHPDMTEDEKKKALRDHLANARKKGAEVRKQRAAERKAKEKAEKQAKKAPKVQMEVEEETQEEEEPEPEPRKPVIMQQEQPKTIRKRQKKATEFVSESAPTPPQVDYERLAELVAGKLKPASAPAPVSQRPPMTQDQYFQQNYLPMQNQMQQYEKIIREQERTRIAQENAKRAEEEKQRKAQEALMQANQNYFRGMPKQAFSKSEDPWSNLFLPKNMRH